MLSINSIASQRVIWIFWFDATRCKTGFWLLLPVWRFARPLKPMCLHWCLCRHWYNKFFFAQKLTVQIKSDSPTQFTQSKKNTQTERELSIPLLLYLLDHKNNLSFFLSRKKKEREKFRFLMLSFPYYSSNIDRISIVRRKRNILSMDFVGFPSHAHRICILKERQKYFPQWIASWCSSWNQKKQKNGKRMWGGGGIERPSEWVSGKKFFIRIGENLLIGPIDEKCRWVRGSRLRERFIGRFFLSIVTQTSAYIYTLYNIRIRINFATLSKWSDVNRYCANAKINL